MGAVSHRCASGGRPWPFHPARGAGGATRSLAVKSAAREPRVRPSTAVPCAAAAVGQRPRGLD